jgi:hypothetical protein
MAVPYQFEPKKKKIKDEKRHEFPPTVVLPQQPLTNRMSVSVSEWCSCGKCELMPTVVECICCKEIPQVLAKLAESDNAQCITQHAKFDAVCVQKEVLQSVAVLLHDVMASNLEEPISNR